VYRNRGHLQNRSPKNALIPRGNKLALSLLIDKYWRASNET
jgi:hypothetical protein